MTRGGRVLPSELTAIGGAGAYARRVADTFARHRLLGFDRDPVTRGPTVEIAHEALLNVWPRLQRWIEDAAARTSAPNVVLPKRLATGFSTIVIRRSYSPVASSPSTRAGSSHHRSDSPATSASFWNRASWQRHNGVVCD